MAGIGSISTVGLSKRVAIRAQKLKISKLVIPPVAVFMVYM